MKILDYSNQARKFLKYSESRVQAILKNKIEEIKLNSYLFGSIKLNGNSFGENSYRVRVGNYRIIYSIDLEKNVLLIVRIESRGKAYTIKEKKEEEYNKNVSS